MAVVMNEDQMHIAALVKAGRQAKGYTQLELAQLCKIGLRSVQRIESGKVTASTYTLKSIAQALEVQLPQAIQVTKPNSNDFEGITALSFSLGRLLIALVTGLILTFLGFAFLFQSSTFPDTTFELFIYWAVVFSLYLVFLIWFFRKKS